MQRRRQSQAIDRETLLETLAQTRRRLGPVARVTFGQLLEPRLTVLGFEPPGRADCRFGLILFGPSAACRERCALVGATTRTGASPKILCTAARKAFDPSSKKPLFRGRGTKPVKGPRPPPRSPSPRVARVASTPTAAKTVCRENQAWTSKSTDGARIVRRFSFPQLDGVATYRRFRQRCRPFRRLLPWPRRDIQACPKSEPLLLALDAQADGLATRSLRSLCRPQRSTSPSALLAGLGEFVHLLRELRLGI